jgi:glucose-1-phosphatase
MPPRVIYFDLGNVLLTFDHELSCRQMADVAGTSPDRVRQVVFEEGLQTRFEQGELTPQAFHTEFCARTQTQPDFDALLHASSAIFGLHVPVVPIVAHLRAAGYRLGILSNTCAPHWQYVSDGRYAIIAKLFDPCILSYRVGAMKPEPEIYRAASEAAGVAPQELFFTDDRQTNVDGALAAGLDAVLYTSPQQLITDLDQRGVRLNL